MSGTACVVLVQELDEEYRYVPKSTIPPIGSSVKVIIDGDAFDAVVMRHIITGDRLYQEQGIVRR